MKHGLYTGIASVLILGIAIVILLLGIVLYGYGKSDGNQEIIDQFKSAISSTHPTSSPAPVEISESDDVETMETELESTIISSPEDDLQQLEEELEEL